MKQLVLETLNYVKQFSGSSVVVKLGGSILDDPELLKALCYDLSLLTACGIRVIIVHGASKHINQALTQQQINSEFIDGMRVTSKEAINVVEMVLCGQVNQVLVRSLNHQGVNAIGLSGADCKLLECNVMPGGFGEVGEIVKVNTALIANLLAQQIIPVIAPVGISPEGSALNINADWAACEIALALNIDKLIYLTDVPGILDQHQQIISTATSSDLSHSISEAVVQGGMLIKVNTIIKALTAGLNKIYVISGKQQHSMLYELFTDAGGGTLCSNLV